MSAGRRATVFLAMATLFSTVPALAQRDEQIRELMKEGMILGIAVTSSGEWVVSSNALYRSVDRGKAWTHVGPQIDRGGALHVAQDGSLYAFGTSYFSPDGKVMLPKEQYAVSLYRSRDAGASWSTVHTWKSHELEPSAVLRTPKGSLLVSSGAFMSEKAMKGVLRSTDDGKTWRLGASDAPWVRSFEVAGDGTLFAASDGGVLVSTDDGASWTPTSHKEMTLAVRVLGNVLFAGAADGLYRSTDKGKTWTAVNALQDRVTMPLLLSKDEVAVVAQPMSTPGITVLLSRDAGQTWKEAAGKSAAKTVELVYSDGTAVYIGLNGLGVLRWANGGSSFEKVFP